VYVRAAAHSELPVALRQAPEDGRELDDAGKSSFPHRRVEAAPFLACWSNLQLGAFQLRLCVDDGSSHTFPDIDEDCALAGSRGLFDQVVWVLVMCLFVVCVLV
jgi:hypothetical protein